MLRVDDYYQDVFFCFIKIGLQNVICLLIYIWRKNKFAQKPRRYVKGEFAVVPTDKISGQSLSLKIPVDMNSIFMKLYVTCSMWPKGHISQKFEFSKFFVVFRPMMNIIFNTTESLRGRNTSNHACQIFCS